VQVETLTEGRASRISLSRAAAQHLIDVGRHLASKKEWWGSTEPSERRSVIVPRELEPGVWEVTVRDAIGLISTPDFQLLVEPKIPRDQLLYLLGLSGAIPRLAEDRGWISEGADLWELIATWFLRATEGVLRRDLVRDYLTHEDELQVVRGTVDSIPSVRDLYRGRLSLHCRYDELGTDTPLNRVLLAASRAIARSGELGWPLRRRAMRVISRMDDVSELEQGDLAARPDRRTAHYADAVTLARHILRGDRRTLEHGGQSAWTFLIRTPEMVEEGIRNALAARLPHRSIRAASISLSGTHRTANPDILVDEGLAVADVKYKLWDGDWNRPDLYQAVAFAAAVRTPHAAIVGFSGTATSPIPAVQWGDVEVRALNWDADAAATPEQAADDLAERAEEWLRYCEAAPDAA
jgi:5-methylcytosine-specific restriction enzyme subunit McrC